jgi:hypothetical protein
MGWGCSSSGEDFSVPDVKECSYCGESKRVTAQFCLSCGTRIKGQSLDLLAADGPPPGGSADPAWNTPITPRGDQHPPVGAGAPAARRFWPPPPRYWALAAAALAVSALALADWRAWPPDLFGSHPRAVAGAVSPHPVRGLARSAPATGSPGRSSAARARTLGQSADPGWPASPAGHGQARGPAATVEGYFTAITRKDYPRAWALGGRSINTSYRSFAQGLRRTDRDTVTILSVAGPDVRARLKAQETDGTVQTFQGTYVVHEGVITQFRVRRVS